MVWVAEGGTTVARSGLPDGDPDPSLGSPRREPVPVDESEASACRPRTQAAQLPRRAPIRLASPHGSTGTAAADLRFHDKATIPSGLVRKILTRDTGLAEDEALKLL